MTKYEQTLDALALLLRTEPLTAKQIAERLGCCRPAVYQRLQALRDRGHRITGERVADRKTGPRALAYRLEG
jgi:biotin operon repressor